MVYKKENNFLKNWSLKDMCLLKFLMFEVLAKTLELCLVC